MTNKELFKVITKLQESLGKKNKGVEIEIKTSAVLKVTKLLQVRNFVTLSYIKDFKYVIKVSNATSNIYCTIETIVKAKDLLNFATKVLPTVTGVVIMSTTSGIMCHEEAHNKNIGGKVMLIAY